MASAAVPAGKRSFPLFPSRPSSAASETSSNDTTSSRPSRSKSLRRIRSTRSSISLTRRANGLDELPPSRPSAVDDAPPLPTAMPLRLDAALHETFGVERTATAPAKRVKVSTSSASTRASVIPSWSLPTVTEKQVLLLPSRIMIGTEVAPRAPLFDLEMFGNGQSVPQSPPSSPSHVFDDYLELGEATYDQSRVSRSTSATDLSLDGVFDHELQYSFTVTPETSPETAEFGEPFVKIHDSPRMNGDGVDPDATWLFNQAEQYQHSATAVDARSMHSVKSEPQIVLPDLPCPSIDLLYPEDGLDSRPVSGAVHTARAVPFERARLLSFSSDSSDDDDHIFDDEEDSHGGLTPANFRSPMVLSRRTSAADYFNLPLRPATAASNRSRETSAPAPKQRLSSRPVTPPTEMATPTPETFSTPEKRPQPSSGQSSFYGMATPPSTPEQRLISASLRYVMPVLEESVAGFPTTMLGIDSPIYNYVAPVPYTSNREAHLPLFRLIFPNTIDFIRSSIFMHLLAIDYLDQLPSTIAGMPEPSCVDPTVYPCPLVTTPRAYGSAPANFSRRIAEVRLRLRECLARLLEASSSATAVKQAKLVAALLAMVRTMKEQETVAAPFLVESGLIQASTSSAGRSGHSRRPSQTKL